MRVHTNTPPSEQDLIRCTACGTYNDPLARPRGGQFINKYATTVQNGQTVTYDNNGAQGCIFCGSPAWADGASLGPMLGWHTRR